MKRVFQGVLVLTVCFALGCAGNATTGGGGDGGATFKIPSPTLATTIKQGATQTIELSVNRDKEFKDDIKLKADPPEKVSVKLDPETYKASNSEKVKMEIHVDKEAAVGDHTIKVIGTPTKGKESATEVKIKVEK